MNADFRRLKFTHTGAQVFDGIPGPRKLQCEVFSPLSLGLVESRSGWLWWKQEEGGRRRSGKKVGRSRVEARG